MPIRGHLSGQPARHLPGEVLAVIVVDQEGAQIAVAGEALHGPHIAPGQLQSLGDRRMPQPVGAHHAQARLFPQAQTIRCTLQSVSRLEG